ncbi:hypothetical protein BYT27DRAFT_7209428 [Phlegmacium glaucopus]|nr:hypothetical protein BYT27DRAFT_7209428 [Phlegmacium glaucopus]
MISLGAELMVMVNWDMVGEGDSGEKQQLLSNCLHFTRNTLRSLKKCRIQTMQSILQHLTGCDMWPIVMSHNIIVSYSIYSHITITIQYHNNDNNKCGDNNDMRQRHATTTTTTTTTTMTTMTTCDNDYDDYDYDYNNYNNYNNMRQRLQQHVMTTCDDDMRYRDTGQHYKQKNLFYGSMVLSGAVWCRKGPLELEHDKIHS